MLSIIPRELREQLGLADPESPTITIRVRIERDNQVSVSFTPSDGDEAPFTKLIAQRIQEGNVQTGNYKFEVQMFEQTRITDYDAYNPDAARQVLNLFRQDLPAIFDALGEVIGNLVNSTKLRELIDQAIFTLMQRNLSSDLVIDPHALRIVAVCPTCAPNTAKVRELGLGQKLEQLTQEILDKRADFEHGDKVMAAVHRVTRAPAPKPNEILMLGPVPHHHPFYALSVLLGETAGNIMLQQRAPVIAQDFAAKVKRVAGQLEILQQLRGTAG